MHTVFSDGRVWPTVRVDEAWRTGLDVISITDHIEYQPHADDVPTNHNRPHELAAGRAGQHNLLLIRGTEITRDTPPGHFNAIFLDDIQPLQTEGFLDAIRQAKAQDAFVFWNHHEWKGPERGAWMDVHTEMYEGRLFQGMEVANGGTYYPQAHRWCLEKNLTMIGSSDIHGPERREENTHDDHRTLTLVFASERTPEAVEEALRAGRTAVWYTDRVIGRRAWLEPLFHRCITVDPPHQQAGNTAWVCVRNDSDLEFRLARQSGTGPDPLVLPPQSETLVRIRLPAGGAPVELAYTVENLLIAPDQGLPVTLRIPGSDE
jgi:hypothetical protein